MKEDCFYIGKIVKKHGFKGEVVLRLDTDIPEAYQDMESLFLQRSGAMVPFFIQRSSLSGVFLRVKFEGVDTEAEAEHLLRCEAYLPMDCLPELEEGQFYYHEVAGYRAVEAASGAEIGLIQRVDDRSPKHFLSSNARAAKYWCRWWTTLSKRWTRKTGRSVFGSPKDCWTSTSSSFEYLCGKNPPIPCGYF